MNLTLIIKLYRTPYVVHFSDVLKLSTALCWYRGSASDGTIMSIIPTLFTKTGQFPWKYLNYSEGKLMNGTQVSVLPNLSGMHIMFSHLWSIKHCSSLTISGVETYSHFILYIICAILYKNIYTFIVVLIISNLYFSFETSD